MENKDKFEVIVLGIIFNPQTKKILIGRRENDPYIKELTWCFPGGKLELNKDVDIVLKEKMKLKTGYKIKNLGSIFSNVEEKRPNQVEIYFLTEAFEGKEKSGDDIHELKWISPKEIENHFTTPIHRKLKKFLLELVE